MVQRCFGDECASSSLRLCCPGAYECHATLTHSGGAYPDEYIYDWADANGVLMWQESMFACSSYPRTKAMLANIAAETDEAVRRYSSHASLAIWGGNNEIEVGFAIMSSLHHMQ